MKIIGHLADRIKYPLPGPQAQFEMAPMGRTEFTNSVKNYRHAAVLCLLYPKVEDLHMVFIKRTSHEKDKHSAQIAFPGGKMEKSDQDHRETALREANEELGIIQNKVEIIGDLTPLKIPVSRFEVFPVLAFAQEQPDFILQESEVEGIIEVSIQELTNPINRKVSTIQLSNGMSLPEVPIFEFGKTVIWGATSMMLNEVIHLLRS